MNKPDTNKLKPFRQPGLATAKNDWKENPKLSLPPEDSKSSKAQRVLDIPPVDAAAQVEQPTERRLFARKMDATAPQDIQQLRSLLSPEYNTLASYKDKLLGSPDIKNQFFLIHGDQMEVYPDLDSALLQGYTRYPADLFFVGQISEKNIYAYLST